MAEQGKMRCVNCGTEWVPEVVPGGVEDLQVLDYSCPVCLFRFRPTATPLAPRNMTRDELAANLDTLISDARSSGLDLTIITQTLRDELEFVAELGSVGRRLYVQIVDLGPQEGTITNRPLRDRGETLQSRTA